MPLPDHGGEVGRKKKTRKKTDFWEGAQEKYHLKVNLSVRVNGEDLCLLGLLPPPRPGLGQDRAQQARNNCCRWRLEEPWFTLLLSVTNVHIFQA